MATPLCSWVSYCRPTGVTGLLTFEPGIEFGSGTWQLLYGGSVYQLTQSALESNNCSTLTLTRMSGDGPLEVTLSGMNFNTGAVNCCDSLGLSKIPKNPTTASWSLSISAQTGGATCITSGPFSPADDNTFPNLAVWIIGNGRTGPCEGEEDFVLKNVGGCLKVEFLDNPSIGITIVSVSAEDGNPWTLVCNISFPAGTIAATAGTATFTVTVNNP